MSKVVDLQTKEVIEQDFTSTQEVETHMMNIPDLEPAEEQWLSDIKDLSPTIKINKDLLDEIFAHVKELSDHYGYDYPEDMICDLLNNGRINLGWEQNNIDCELDDEAISIS